MARTEEVRIELVRTGGNVRWPGQVDRTGGEGRWRGQVVRMLEEKWPFASSPANMNNYLLNDEID